LCSTQIQAFVSVSSAYTLPGFVSLLSSDHLHTKTIRSRPEPEGHISSLRVLAASSSLAEREDTWAYEWAASLVVSAMEYRGRFRSARCTPYHSSKHLPLVHRTGGVRRKSRYRAPTFGFLSLLHVHSVLDRQGTHHSLAGYLYASAYDLILVRGVSSCWDVLLWDPHPTHFVPV
jgi:hypothetical protein